MNEEQEDRDWVICRGVERAVMAAGLVRCPQSRHVAITDCLGCRHLETLWLERDWRAGCGSREA